MLRRKPLLFILVFGWIWSLGCFSLSLLIRWHRHQPITEAWLPDLVIWLLAGLGWGTAMWFSLRRRLQP